MSSSHESEFHPLGLLKPNSSTPGSNEIILPYVGQQGNKGPRPGATSTAPADHPTATATRRATETSKTATSTPEPSKTATAPATETPKPTETPPAKEYLAMSPNMPVYWEGHADPYNVATPLGAHVPPNLEVVDINVSNEPGTGWVIHQFKDDNDQTVVVPVAYRFSYVPYIKGTHGQIPNEPAQEAKYFEVLVNDLAQAGILQTLSEVADHVYSGERKVTKTVSTGVGLIDSSPLADTHHDYSDNNHPLQAAATGLLGALAMEKMTNEGDSTDITRRSFLKRAALAFAGLKVGGQVLDLIADVDAGEILEPVDTRSIPMIKASSINMIDPCVEIPKGSSIEFRAYLEAPKNQTHITFGNDPSREGGTHILFGLIRAADANTYIYIPTIDGHVGARVNMGELPEDHIAFEVKLAPDRKQATLRIQSKKGDFQTISIPVDGLNFSSLYTGLYYAGNPQDLAAHITVSFDAQPGSLFNLTSDEPDKRLQELQAINHKPEQLNGTDKCVVYGWATGLTSMGNAHTVAADWSRNPAMPKDVVFDTKRTTPLEFTNFIQPDTAPYVRRTPLSLYDQRELADHLEKTDGSLLRKVHLEDIPGNANPSDTRKYLTALQEGRTPGSRIKLLLNGFISSTGLLSRPIEAAFGNSATFAQSVEGTLPQECTFDPVITLPEIQFSDKFVKTLVGTLGAINKGRVKISNVIVSSRVPAGATAEIYISQREALIQALSALDIQVGAYDVQSSGAIPSSQEVQLAKRNIGEGAPLIMSEPAYNIPDQSDRHVFDIHEKGGLFMRVGYTELQQALRS